MSREEFMEKLKDNDRALKIAEKCKHPWSEWNQHHGGKSQALRCHFCKKILKIEKLPEAA